MHWVFVAVCRHSLVAASRATLDCGAQASQCSGFSCCGAQALGVWAQWLLHTGLAALQHMGSSWTREQTYVPSSSRQSPIHCTTREVLEIVC